MRLRALIVSSGLALLATSCFQPSGTDTLGTAIKEAKDSERLQDVRPPPAPDAARTGRIGVRLATNSVGWQRALKAPEVRGAVILFVVPGSPAERADLRRGDVIVARGSVAVRNDERAIALLRARPGETVALRVARGRERLTVNVQARALLDRDLGQILDRLLDRKRDPTIFFLRAQTRSDQRQALDDVNEALELAPELVDALAYRARLFWRESLQVGNDVIAQTDRKQALDDFSAALRIDPDAVDVMVDRAQSLLEVGEFDRAVQDGFRALRVDASFPAAHNIVAAARLGRGEAGPALAPARKAVELNPYNPRYYRTLAQVFLELGRRDDAQATVNAGLAVATGADRQALLGVLGAQPT